MKIRAIVNQKGEESKTACRKRILAKEELLDMVRAVNEGMRRKPNGIK